MKPCNLGSLSPLSGSEGSGHLVIIRGGKVETQSVLGAHLFPFSVKKQVWFNLSLRPIIHCLFSSCMSVPSFRSDYQTIAEGQGLFQRVVFRCSCLLFVLDIFVLPQIGP